MNPHELKRAINEALDERLARRSHPHWHLTAPDAHGPAPLKPKMEFSKKLIIGASFFYSFMCTVALLSWFLLGEWPREIVEHFSWPFGAAVVSYMCKTAYENKPKIQKGWDVAKDE